jgi:hypothetical protein
MDDTKQEQATLEGQPTPPTQPKTTLEEQLEGMRADLKYYEEGARALRDRLPADLDPALRGEAIAQSMLAARHLEDARMRLGKVLQYGVQGGVSKYDR